MGKSKDLATGASYVDTSGDTMTGNLGVNVSPTAALDVRRSDTDGKIAEFHQSGGYGFELSSSQTVARFRSGYLQAMSITTDAGSGAAERMRISKEGYVTKPNQPCFHARRTAGHGTTGTIIFNHADVNVGNHYSTSTGNFTAPIAGKYVLFTTVLSASGTNVGADMKINGTRYAVTEESWANQSSTYRATSLTAIASLSANDAVRVENKQGGYYGSNAYTFFGGYLLG